MEKWKLIFTVLIATALSFGCTEPVSETSERYGAQRGESDVSNDDEVAGSEITVSCYDDMALYRMYLEEAAKLFEQQYPDVKVRIEAFAAMPQIYYTEDGNIDAIFPEDNPQKRADYISKTSTLMMGGEGADLLAIDVLPFYHYIEAGQLENLKELMDNDSGFQKSDYRENILAALEFESGIWFLPMDYSFNYYAYDATLLTVPQDGILVDGQAITTKQSLELGKVVFDGVNRIHPAPPYLKDGAGDLFTQLFSENYEYFIDLGNKTANFNDGVFRALLEDIKDLAEQGYVRHITGYEIDSLETMEAVYDEPNERFVFKLKNQFSLVQETSNDPNMRLGVSASGVSNGIERDDLIAGIHSDEAGVVPFTYEMAFGMNANGKNKETTWEFLKFLLSYDLQISQNIMVTTLPLHNEARKDGTEIRFRMILNGGREIDESFRQNMEDYLTVAEALSDRINGYTFKDSVIKDMVVKEVGYFIEGVKTADQVCQVLQNKVELYLNE